MTDHECTEPNPDDCRQCERELLEQMRDDSYEGAMSEGWGNKRRFNHWQPVPRWDWNI